MIFYTLPGYLKTAYWYQSVYKTKKNEAFVDVHTLNKPNKI